MVGVSMCSGRKDKTEEETDGLRSGEWNYRPCVAFRAHRGLRKDFCGKAARFGFNPFKFVVGGSRAIEGGQTI